MLILPRKRKLGERKSRAQGIQLESARPEPELRPSNSRASDANSALSAKPAKWIAMTESSWSSLLMPSTKHLHVQPLPPSTELVCQMSSGFLRVIQMFVADVGDEFSCMEG